MKGLFQLVIVLAVLGSITVFLTLIIQPDQVVALPEGQTLFSANKVTIINTTKAKILVDAEHLTLVLDRNFSTWPKLVIILTNQFLNFNTCSCQLEILPEGQFRSLVTIASDPFARSIDRQLLEMVYATKMLLERQISYPSSMSVDPKGFALFTINDPEYLTSVTK